MILNDRLDVGNKKLLNLIKKYYAVIYNPLDLRPLVKTDHIVLL